MVSVLPLAPQVEEEDDEDEASIYHLFCVCFFNTSP